MCDGRFYTLVLVLLVLLLVQRGMGDGGGDGDGDGDGSSVEVVVLSGQSNMSGRGGVHSVHPHGSSSVVKQWDGIVPSGSRAAPAGSVLRFSAAGDWEEAREPLHADIDVGKVCGIGPGLSFAAAAIAAASSSCVADDPDPDSDSAAAAAACAGRRIGLVPCAIGGTSIKQWRKGGALYASMLSRTSAALSKLGGGCKLRALLWYQGESDTLHRHDADAFLADLHKLFLDIRDDLRHSYLPIIHVGITAAKHPHPELLDKVRRAQQSLKMPNLFYVDALGLPLLEDGVHLTTEAQAQLGKLLAASYTANVSALSSALPS